MNTDDAMPNLVPPDDLVRCSRCPYAMYATLIEPTDSPAYVVFWCENCDRQATP